MKGPKLAKSMAAGKAPKTIKRTGEEMISLKRTGILLVLALSLSGCLTVSPEPFGKFSSSAQELRDGADVALSVNDVQNRQRFIDETAKDSLSENGAEAILNLMLENVPGDPFTWKMEKVPLFMASERLRGGLYTVNETLVTYSELLKSLASPELVSQEQFDEISKTLNANLMSAAQSLDFDKGEKGIAIFSVASSKAAQLYIENKRGKHLASVITENQKNIESLGRLMRRSLKNAARNLTANYQAQSDLLAQELTPIGSASLAERIKQVEAFVALNEDYVERLKVLKILDRSYAALPKAHLELLTSIEHPELGLSSIKELASTGKHLSKLYKKLTKEIENQ